MTGKTARAKAIGLPTVAEHPRAVCRVSLLFHPAVTHLDTSAPEADNRCNYQLRIVRRDRLAAVRVAAPSAATRLVIVRPTLGLRTPAHPLSARLAIKP